MHLEPRSHFRTPDPRSQLFLQGSIWISPRNFKLSKCQLNSVCLCLAHLFALSLGLLLQVNHTTRCSSQKAGLLLSTSSPALSPLSPKPCHLHLLKSSCIHPLPRLPKSESPVTGGLCSLCHIPTSPFCAYSGCLKLVQIPQRATLFPSRSLAMLFP